MFEVSPCTYLNNLTSLVFKRGHHVYEVYELVGFGIDFPYAQDVA